MAWGGSRFSLLKPQKVLIFEIILFLLYSKTIKSLQLHEHDVATHHSPAGYYYWKETIELMKIFKQLVLNMQAIDF